MFNLQGTIVLTLMFAYGISGQVG